MRPIVVWRLLTKTFDVWVDTKAPTMGAALAFYTAFSATPLLLIVLAVASFVFGAEAASGDLAAELRSAFGDPVAEALQTMVQYSSKFGNGVVQVIIGVIVLFIGASGVFAELQTALDTIWSVEPKPNRGFLGILRDRFLSFSMVLGACFILLASLVLATVLTALARYWTPASLPGGVYLWNGVNALASFAIISGLFALIYKVLPDVHLSWKEVWVGAVVTALLFTLGKFLLGLYIAYSGVTTPYGAAGSLVLVLLWVYYSAQIFLFGAAFTRVYTEEFYRGIQPQANAVLVKKTVVPVRDASANPVSARHS